MTSFTDHQLLILPLAQYKLLESSHPARDISQPTDVTGVGPV